MRAGRACREARLVPALADAASSRQRHSSDSRGCPASLIRRPQDPQVASILRCLTGCVARSLRDIQPVGGGPALRVYARVGGLQQTGTTPEDFLREVAAKRCSRRSRSASARWPIRWTPMRCPTLPATSRACKPPAGR
ncbi:MAG: hypothetical protein MZW92_35045 [Comamonadaceae bacterium]|nr:hypothetical protein [Comamonadaceae bacterium]